MIGLPDVDFFGRAAVQSLWTMGESAAQARAIVHDVPCVSLNVDAWWATKAVFTAEPELPPAPHLIDIVGWLGAQRPRAWQLRVRVEHGVFAGCLPVLELGVWATDQRPGRLPRPAEVEITPAGTAAEFLDVFGWPLAPLIEGPWGRADQSFLVVRERGTAIGCARVTELAGNAYVSGVQVREDRRGRGYGRLISAAATEDAVSRAGLAWLHCEDAVAPIYQKLGYRRVTTHVDLALASEGTG